MKKSINKRILEKILKILTVKIVQKYKPDIIGITGSVGKTSTKEAVYSVLKEKFNVRRNVKNYNNEIGVPLTVIGQESGGHSIFRWFWIFLKAIILILGNDKNYPKILALEMGADRPGDIGYLVDMVPCKVGLVTAIGTMGPVHVEFFKDIDQLVKEKKKIVSHLKKDDWAILNQDDERVYGMKEGLKSQVITFGFGEEADLTAKEFKISKHLHLENDQQITGVSFKLSYQGSIVPVFLPNVLGKHQVYVSLAAAAVGKAFDMNLVDISRGLMKYQSPRGRMTLLKGIKDTLIIDDTYNSSPVATVAALGTLRQAEINGRRFACLADMAELGSYTEEGHAEVGERAAQTCDYLITVGDKAKMMAESAREHGLSEDHIFTFANSEEAGKFVQKRLKLGDLVLAKGSQSMRMEKLVKEIMAEPWNAKKLLVRQEASWV